jgi:hypothetical protein
MIKLMVKWVVLILLMIGCAGFADEKENWMKFDETSRSYLLALRWGEFEAAQDNILQSQTIHYCRK